MSAATFKPMKKSILIKQDTAAEKSDGGIVLAGKARRPPETGTVVSVGKDVQDVAVGQKVMFDTRIAQVLNLEPDTVHLLIKEAGIIAVIED